MIYEIGNRGLKPITIHENEAKNNLPVGTVLHLNGYNNPDYVIVKNLGISENFRSHGSKYLTISLEDLGQRQRHAYELKYLREKQDGRIQIYITDKILTADETLDIWEKSEAKRKRMDEAQSKAKQETDALEIRGRELFKKHIPENAQALIVACHDTNDSDIQSDYFAHTTSKIIVLGHSAHKRDLFSEMRKHADRIPETAHLKTASKEAEHREKWSMGDGYYLKDGYRHNTSWRIEKVRKYGDDWDRGIYIAMAKRCVINRI